MAETLMLKAADVDALADMLATMVVKRLEPLLSSRQQRLVDRPTMATMLGVSVPMLDRLVASRQVPSVLVGVRRLFDPDRVVEALASAGAVAEEPQALIRCRSMSFKRRRHVGVFVPRGLPLVVGAHLGAMGLYR